MVLQGLHCWVKSQHFYRTLSPMDLINTDPLAFSPQTIVNRSPPLVQMQAKLHAERIMLFHAEPSSGTRTLLRGTLFHASGKPAPLTDQSNCFVPSGADSIPESIIAFPICRNMFCLIRNSGKWSYGAETLCACAVQRIILAKWPSSWCKAARSNISAQPWFGRLGGWETSHS